MLIAYFNQLLVKNLSWKSQNVSARDNNDSILKFIFEKYPNLYTRENKIVLRGAIN